MQFCSLKKLSLCKNQNHLKSLKLCFLVLSLCVIVKSLTIKSFSKDSDPLLKDHKKSSKITITSTNPVTPYNRNQTTKQLTTKTETKTIQPKQRQEYLVPDGRKKYLEVLMRYLEPNLKVNGGILDKIIFGIIITPSKEDVDYIESFLNRNKSYFEKVNLPSGVHYTRLYETMADDDLVFKIDDDIVFIQNGTFERMKNEYLSKNLLYLSANVVNHALLSYAHAKIRAILPFVEVNNSKWELNTSLELDSTVAVSGTYEPFSQCWWNSGKCASLAHESFLYHVNNNPKLDVYDFKYWDFHHNGYIRWSVNFFVSRGLYVNQLGDSAFDELLISTKIPERLGKHCYAIGNAVVVHFSYSPQKNYLESTNFLSRYEIVSKKYLNI